MLVVMLVGIVLPVLFNVVLVNVMTNDSWNYIPCLKTRIEKALVKPYRLVATRITLSFPYPQRTE